MSWDKPKRKISRVYDWVWDNVESIKSFILTFLILFSILLTWQLWTYTPKLEKLDDTDPIVSSIEDGRKMQLGDVIEPSKVLLHHNGKHYWVPTFTMDPGNVYEQLQHNALLVKDDRTLAKSVQNYTNKFEIHYPTAIPMQVLKNIFQFSNEHPFQADLGSVTSIELFEKNKDWYVRFVTENSDKAHYDFQITEDRGFTDTVEAFVNNNDMEEVEEFTLNGEKYYLPKGKPEIERYLYQIEESDIDDYLNFLLPGDTVKIDSLENRATYSDGKSIIQYFKGQKNFTLTSPSSRSNADPTVNLSGIMQGVDFINSHTGWTDAFHLYEYSSIDQDYEGTNDHEEMEFRMVLKGIPVMDNPLSKISLEYTNHELYRYERSLLYLPKNPVKPINVKLKSGAEVIQELQQLPSIKVKDIMIGYHVINNEDEPSFTFEPEWYYKVGSTWYPVDSIEPPVENEGG